MVQAIRYDDRAYEPGDILPASRVWDDGEPTAEMLPGTSTLATECDSRYGRQYAAICEHKYLVEGRYVSDGYDNGELILADCTVVEVLK
jgi:hypothetical protein